MTRSILVTYSTSSCSLTEQYEWAAARGIRWLVILDPAKLGGDSTSSATTPGSSATTKTHALGGEAGLWASGNGSAMVKVRVGWLVVCLYV